ERAILVAANRRRGEAGVASDQCVVAGAGRIAVRDDAADPGLLEDVAADACRKEILPRDRAAGQRGVGKRTRLDVEHADVVVTLASGELRAYTDWHGEVLEQTDPPAEERPDVGRIDQAGDVEYAGAFKKERALFRKEQRKAGQVHLAEVGFGLGEVGVDRERRAETWREVLEDVQSERR